MANIKEKPKKKEEVNATPLKKADVSNLHHGTATPYIALFNYFLEPIMNPLTGIPLGAYMTRFAYNFDQESENVCEATFDTGDPATADIEELKEDNELGIQFGYIYADRTYKSSKLHYLKVKEVDCVFDDQGTHITIRMKDSVNDLRGSEPYKPAGEGYTFKDFLDEGMGLMRGLIIEKFEPIGED